MAGAVRSAARLSIAAACVAFLLPGCAAEGHQQEQVTAAASPVFSPPQLRATLVPLPGFESPAHVTGDPSGAGAYFLGGLQDTRVFHWDGAHLRSWPVGGPAAEDPELATAIQYGIAATATGHVWLGINDLLLDLDTATGHVRRGKLPPATDAVAAEAWRSVQLRGAHPVVALAVTGAGDEVAVLRDMATDVELWSPATGTFRRIVLSADFQPTSVAFTGTGALAVAAWGIPGTGHAQMGQVSTIDPATATVLRTRLLPAAVSIAATPGGGIVTSVGNVGGPVVEWDSTGAPQPVTAATPKVPIHPGVDVLSVSASRIAEGTPEGLTLFDTTTGAEQDVAFPTWDCSSSEGSVMAEPARPASAPASATTAAPPADPDCSRGAIALAMDGAGDLWAATTGPDTMLVELPAIRQR